TERQRELRRRRHRRAKLRYLRARLERTTDPKERERLIAKMRKISPRAPIPES
ncbi:MAG: hypothetical protein H5T59_06175, partial [Anaerolineae bacterium]|nr:hypothetical protein [Anaerolineae bacterium]